MARARRVPPLDAADRARTAHRLDDAAAGGGHPRSSRRAAEPHRAHHALRPGAQRSRGAPGVERGAAGHRASATACGGAHRAGRAAGRARRRPHRRDRVRFPVQRGAAAVLNRLQRHRRPARQLVLRHARVRSAARELHGHRNRHCLARALVQARPIADAERQLARAPLVERIDVRVSDAAARHATLPGHAARRDVQRRRPAAD